VRSDILYTEALSPPTEGKYVLKVSAMCMTSHPQYESVLLLPVLSGEVNIVQQIGEIPSKSIQVLLKNYRTISSSKGFSLAIVEDYGATLGSHLYDSSIILLRYIDNFPSGSWLTKKVLELGAGCGLVGLYIGQLSDRIVVISDKRCQQYLIEMNIAANQMQRKCRFLECDWSNDNHVREVVLQGSDQQYDFIIATDVLYDLTTASLFFSVIRRIAFPMRTIVLVAQKIRDPIHAVNGLVEVPSIPGFTSVKKVHYEADVVIWSLLLEFQ
jgi:predicted nicotinamide N-methyase